jgi:hypothetical protein
MYGKSKLKAGKQLEELADDSFFWLFYALLWFMGMIAWGIMRAYPGLSEKLQFPQKS